MEAGQKRKVGEVLDLLVDRLGEVEDEAGRVRDDLGVRHVDVHVRVRLVDGQHRDGVLRQRNRGALGVWLDAQLRPVQREVRVHLRARQCESGAVDDDAYHLRRSFVCVN